MTARCSVGRVTGRPPWRCDRHIPAEGGHRNRWFCHRRLHHCRTIARVRLVSNGVGRDTRYGILRALHHRGHNRCSVVVRSFRLGADRAVILEWRLVDCPQYHFSASRVSVAVCCFGCCRHPGPGGDKTHVPCTGWLISGTVTNGAFKRRRRHQALKTSAWVAGY